MKTKISNFINKIFFTSVLFLISSKSVLAEDFNLESPVGGDLQDFLLKAAKFLTIVAAVGFLFMLLYGGFIYLTSEGNAENEEKGKKTIVWAITGIIIVSGVYLLKQYLETNIKTVFPE